MTSAEQVQIAAAVLCAFALLVAMVLSGIAGYHINNEMIRQARGPESPGRPETRQQAQWALSLYLQQYPNGSLRKARRMLVWSSGFAWMIMIALLFIVWNIMANR